MQADHTVQAYDEDLVTLMRLVEEMGREVLGEFDLAAKGLVSGDRTAARDVIELDATIDGLEQRIHAEVFRVIARHQPVANDLRRIIAAERIASYLERVGDYAKNIAKRSLALDGSFEGGLVALLERLILRVRKMIEDVVAAFSAEDDAAARRVWLADSELDELCDDFFHHVVSDMQLERSSIPAGTQLLFVAKALERIGDHATNVAEEVCFMTRGEMLDHRPKA